MARDDSAKAKKQKWSDWINANLQERRWNAADLVTATGEALIYGTVYNWTKGTARAEAEAAVIVAMAFKVSPSEALNAASYPVLANAFEGKELRLVGTPAEPPDEGILKIMQSDLPDSTKATMIRWWNRRSADEEQRRIVDVEQMIALSAERETA